MSLDPLKYGLVTRTSNKVHRYERNKDATSN